ncbi:MAG: hypothetical protein ACE3L7_27815 [Candidatus Pristimantibacillus sp.]
MTKKLPVLLKSYIKSHNPYDNLKFCRHCKHFTVLGDKECLVCGKSTLQTVEERAASMLRKSMWKARLIALFIMVIGIVLSQSTAQIILCTAGSILLLALLLTFQRRMTPALLLVKLEQLFQQEAYTLYAGLVHDREAAIEVFHSGNKPRAYEMLREIGALVHTDQLRVEQILLLQSFILRKDMDLMLEPLLMDHFNPDLVEYIGELSKIRRDLLKENTFRYILVHEEQILAMPGGENILVGVAGAAVRLKRYITLYPYLMLRYAHKMPKDRFLRLYQIVRNNPNPSWGKLNEEVTRIYDEKYKWDEDFQRINKEQVSKEPSGS